MATDLELLDGPILKDGDGDDGAIAEPPVLIIKDKEGGFHVFLNGVQVRAVIRDYDIAFPMPAMLIEQDDAGDNFIEVMV